MSRIAILGSEPDALAAAIVLARAGREVHVFEPSDQIGGRAWSAHSIAPGCMAQGYHHDVFVAPDTMKALGLLAEGLTTTHAPASVSWRDGTCAEVSASETAALQARHARMAIYDVTGAQLARQAAPQLLGERDWMSIARAGLSVRMLGARNMSDLLRRSPLAIRDDLDEDGLHGDVAAGEALKALFGTWLGPFDPTATALACLRHTLRKSTVASGVTLCETLATRAKNAGVVFHVGQPIEGIDIGADGADGVRVGGARHATDAILHGADPKALLRLLDPLQRPPSLSRDLEHLRARGTIAIAHLATKGPLLPHAQQTTGCARLATTLETMERAHDAKKRGRMPEEPGLTVRQWADVSPDGLKSSTVCVHGVPHTLKDSDAVTGWLQHALSEHFGATKPEAIEVVLPSQMARADGMHGTHIYHAETSLDQLWSLRPAQSLVAAGTRIPGLYHASLASHPGPLAVCNAGTQAAQTILSDLS